MFSSSGAVKESLIREREGQEKLKGGTCAYAGGVCSAATSLNLLCIVEGCLVYTRLHMCLVSPKCKASSGTWHTHRNNAYIRT